MPLLMLSERYPPDLGGVARSCARIAGALQQVAGPVHVLAWTKLLPAGKLVSEPAGGVSDSRRQPSVHRLGAFGSLDLTMQHSLSVVEWLHSRHAFDAVWGHYAYPAGFLAATVGGLLNIRSTVSARGNDIDRLMFPPGDFARLMWTLERADVLSAVSEELAEKIQMLTRRADDVEVIGNAVDAEVFEPAPPDMQLRRDLGIAPHEAVLGFCGELRHKKGLPFVLAALQEVRRRRPACLLVIGEIRAREQATLAEYLAEDPASGKRILVTGVLDAPAEVARRLQLCDVVLMPSLWDGLPNALLEAMACERVVVASDAGGIPEVIAESSQGVVLPRAHLHRLGEAVLRVLDLSPEQRAAVGQAARRRVTESFHPKAERAALARVTQRLEGRR